MEITLEILIGAIGAMLVLVPFLLAQANKIDSKSFLYDLSNALGSIFLFASAWLSQNIVFVVTNLVWGFFSAKDVVVYLWYKRK